MDIDVQKELKAMYQREEFESLNYIYFELFEEKNEDKEFVFKELINHAIERYPELLNLILNIKGIDCNKYYDERKKKFQK